MVSFLKNYDLFGEKVSMNYRGDSTFKTWLGTFCTVISSTVLIFYACLKMQQLFLGTNPNISSIEVFNDGQEYQ